MRSTVILTTKATVFLMIFSLLLVSCKKEEKSRTAKQSTTTEAAGPFFKLSLAQWSMNKAIRFEGMDPLDFAEKASGLGFEGLEYVSQLYTKKLENMDLDVLLDSIKAKSDQYGMQNVLIMVDGEGDLASPDEAVQDEAVEKHKKWVDAAQNLGCHSIRVNLFGTNDAEIWKKTAAQGLGKLSVYAATKKINVIVENHGGLSSNAALLAGVIKAVGKDNCGTLPDFGNFCTKREDGSTWDSPCIEEYDMYKGVEEMMPYAKAVSAKTYDFDDKGQETKIDYARMLQLVKDAGYTGYIGVEYEGSRLGEEAGILATKELLLNASKQLN